MVMELIRDQGFREQRGEYGSRVGGGHGGGGNGGGGNGGGNGGDGGGGGNGGDSLDVSVSIKMSQLFWREDVESVSELVLFFFPRVGSCSSVCSGNCYWQKWRDDQENTERHRRQNSV